MHQISLSSTANVFGAQFGTQSVIYLWKPDIVTSAKDAKGVTNDPKGFKGVVSCVRAHRILAFES